MTDTFNSSNPVARPPSSSWGWIVFLVIFVAATLFVAALHGEINARSIGFGIGMTAIPALIGGFMMRKGRNPVPGLAVFLVLVALLHGREVVSKFDEARVGVETGCMEKNTYIDTLPADQQKPMCACISQKLGPKIQWHLTVMAITFQTPPANAADDPWLAAAATEVWSQCLPTGSAN